MLKKNFARGSFGEIWLGVRRPCWRDVGGKMEFLAGSNTSSTSSHRETFQAPQDSCSMLGAKIYNEEGGTSSKQWTAGDLSGYADDMFILKRILVFSLSHNPSPFFPLSNSNALQSACSYGS